MHLGKKIKSFGKRLVGKTSPHQQQPLGQFLLYPLRVMGPSWKVSTSRRALLPHGWRFAGSFPLIFMLIHPVACVLLDMPFFCPPSWRGEPSLRGLAAFPREGCAWECCSGLELHGLQLHFVLSGPVVSQVSLSSVVPHVHSH